MKRLITVSISVTFRLGKGLATLITAIDGGLRFLYRKMRGYRL